MVRMVSCTAADRIQLMQCRMIALRQRGFLFLIGRLILITWSVAEAKCILIKAVCVSVCVSVCRSLAAFPHYCADLEVTWGDGRGCPLVVQYWTDLQSVHEFRCYGNIAPNAKCQRVLVLTLCLVLIFVTSSRKYNQPLLITKAKFWFWFW